jgi:hypothetical protein
MRWKPLHEFASLQPDEAAQCRSDSIMDVAWVRLALETTDVPFPSEANPLVQKYLRLFSPRQNPYKLSLCRLRVFSENALT